MQRPQLSRQHISSPLTVVDSDDEEGPVVEGWSIFENSTDSSSSETTLGLDAPQSPIWEDRLESFLRRRRAFSVDHEAAATPTKKRTKRAPARKTFAPPAAAKAAPKQEAPPPPRLARAQSWTGE
jgi:hypothetical protein